MVVEEGRSWKRGKEGWQTKRRGRGVLAREINDKTLMNRRTRALGHAGMHAADRANSALEGKGVRRHAQRASPW